MLKLIKEYFKKAQEEGKKQFAEKLDSFNDPLAKEIEWSFISRCGYFYKNRKFHQNKEGDIIFYPTVWAILFPLLFLVMGIFIMYRFALYKIHIIHLLYQPIDAIHYFINILIRAGFSDMLYGFFFGLIFFIPGLIVIYYAIKPIVFRAKDSIYCKGFFLFGQKCTPFSEIHAIQLLSDLGGGPESYTNYELNLVLKSGKRVNVFAHAKEDSVREDAARLSQFLCIPIWDMI